MKEDCFGRMVLLVGEQKMQRLKSARVILFGTGGVGSWCAEALIRSGIGHLTLVDFDNVAESNINRQLMATSLTVGRKKAEVLGERLREISPEAEVQVMTEAYCAGNAALFRIEDYDYVVDAIDSLADKADLIRRACETDGVTLFSSMGAASKIDSSCVRTSEFAKVNGCGLARALRRRFKSEGRWPCRKFVCVWSDEMLPDTRKGTVMHVTATFGLKLAELVIRDRIAE